MGKKIYSLYLLKCICAFFVVGIHFPFYGKGLLLPLIVVAVPVFFIISGYFVCPSMDNKEKSLSKLRGAISKTFKTILVLNLLYLLWLYFANGDWPIKSLIGFLRFIVMGDNISTPLWYLTAYLWTLIFYYLIFKLDRLNLLFRARHLFPVLILLNLLFGRYSFWSDFLQQAVGFRLSFVSVGIPCFTLGMLLRDNCQAVIRQKKFAVVALVVCLVAVYGENALLTLLGVNNGVSYLLMTMPLAASMFALALAYADKVAPGNLLARVGERDSANIYYFHVLVGGIIGYFYSNDNVQALLVAAGVLLLSEVLVRLRVKIA